MEQSTEERFPDVLYNIEIAIKVFYQDNPNLSDFNVDNALSGLIRVYKAQMAGTSAPRLKLSEIEQELYDRVKTQCDLIIGLEVSLIEGEENTPPRTTGDIILCLKRIRRSINFWRNELGRQGYLNYITDFLD
jgi:hypothetical protein